MGKSLEKYGVDPRYDMQLDPPRGALCQYCWSFRKFDPTSTTATELSLQGTASILVGYLII